MASSPNVRVVLTRPPSSHSAYAQLVGHPPPGVDYSWRDGSSTPKTDSARTVAVGALRLLGLPNLTPWRDGRKDVDVVHSCQALLLSSRPWVVDIEHASPFVGIHFDRLTSARVRWVIARVLTHGR